MLKLYCKAALLGGLLCILSPANAQQTIDLNSTCAEYQEEVLRLQEQHVQSGLDISTFRLGRVNPTHDFLEPILQNLDQDARARIAGPLAELVWYNCKDLEESGLSSDSKVSESLERAIVNFGLDMTKPRWGLIDLPRIDFDTMRVRELDENLSKLTPDLVQNPVNDILAAAFTRYLVRFDLSSHEADEKVQRLYTGISFLGDPEHAESTISELLDEYAVELSLIQN